MTEKTGGKTRSSLMQRVITAVPLVIALVAALAIGGWVLAAVVLVCVALAVYEELGALKQGGHRPVWWPSFAALVISAPLMMNYSYMGMVPVLLAMCLCIMLTVMLRKTPELTDILVSVLPLFSLVVPAMCLLGILDTQPRILQMLLLIFVFTTSIGGDTFAYFVGRAVGGPKLCPQISPNKTIAGGIGGLAGSVGVTVLAGLIFQWVAPEFAGFPPLWANALVGLVGGLGAQLGDLFASLVKRHCKLKDFGHIFPGHGGMLDRLDSIVFTAVVIYCYRVILLGLG